MSNLHELFDQATAVAPPSRLSVEDVLSATGSWRRRRRRRQNALVAVCALVMLATGGAIMVAARPAPHYPPIHPDDGATLQDGIIWAERGDATHLYLVKNSCKPRPSGDAGVAAEPAGCRELLASKDGGATWVSRGIVIEQPRVLDPLTLMRYAGPGGTPDPTTEPPDSSLTFEMSTDGGATWRRLPVQGTSVEAIPPGGAVVEGFGRELTVYDPAQGRLRRHSHQPALRQMLGDLVVTSSGDIWISGLNPATLRPAVAVSHDAGATWTERDLPGTAVVPQATLPNGEIDPNQATGQPLQLITGPGATAYATIYDGAQPASPPPLPGTDGIGWLRTYVTTDGGQTWRAVADVGTTPSYSHAWMTADGRIVTVLPGRDIGGTKKDVYAVSADGITYEPAVLPGLPESLRFVDGSTAYKQNVMYVSDDGWTWREVWREP